MTINNLAQLNDFRKLIATSKLPMLDGSPEQVSWANFIRMDIFIEVNYAMARCRCQLNSGDIKNIDLTKYSNLINSLHEETDAEWWISVFSNGILYVDPDEVCIPSNPSLATSER